MFASFYDVMIAKGRWMLIPRGLGTTLLIAFFAVLIGSVLGCVFALFKISKSKVLNCISAVYTTIIRGIPMATQLMIFYFVIFSPMGVNNAVLVAIIAFGINSGAYCTEIFRAGIQGVDKGQMEAGRSLGLSWNQTLVKIVLPQAIKTSLPTYTSEFITMIKKLLLQVLLQLQIYKSPAITFVMPHTTHGFLFCLVQQSICVLH